MRLCPTNNRGFTLLETLAAIFIFSLLSVSCNAVYALIRKNAALQMAHNHTVQIQQRAVTLFVADLLQAEVSPEHPLSLFPMQVPCRKSITFYTRNLANQDNQYGNPLHQVTWSFSAQGVMRTVLTEQGSHSVKMLPAVECMDFSLFSHTRWQRPDVVDIPASGFAFNLVISPLFHIERFIPTGIEASVASGDS